MMLPGITASPPYFLTPRRRPAESRPLREEPPAFLCAISCYSFRPSALGQLFGLVDPALALDPALEGQLFIHISNIGLGPRRDLRESGDAGFLQFLLKCGANARQLLEIVATLVRLRSRFGGGFLGRRGLGFGFGLLGRVLFRRCLFGGRLGFGGACGDGRDRPRAQCGLDARLVGALLEDLGHPQQGQLLTMPDRALGAVLTAALDEIDDLVALDLVDHLGLHGRAIDERRADHRLVAAKHQDLVELNFLTGIGCQLLNAQHVAGLHLVLLATGFHNRKHLHFLFACRVLWSRFPDVPGPAPLAKTTSNSAPLMDDHYMTRTGKPAGMRAYSKTGPQSQGAAGVFGLKAVHFACAAPRPVPADRKSLHTCGQTR